MERTSGNTQKRQWSSLQWRGSSLFNICVDLIWCNTKWLCLFVNANFTYSCIQTVKINFFHDRDYGKLKRARTLKWESCLFESQLWHLLLRWSQQIVLYFLELSFIIYRQRIIVSLPTGCHKDYTYIVYIYYMCKYYSYIVMLFFINPVHGNYLFLQPSVGIPLSSGLWLFTCHLTISTTVSWISKCIESY